MKTHTLLLSIFCLALLSACKKNKGTIQQTYNKAIAVYEDENTIRKININAPSRSIQNTGKIFYGKDVILIGEKNEGIHIINNTSKGTPTNAAFINLPYTNEFYVKDNIIYAICHYDLVKIDIASPSQPQLIYRVNNAFGNTIKDANGRLLVGFDHKITTETFEIGSAKEVALRENSTLYFDFQDEVIPFSEVPSSFIGSSAKNKGTLNRLAFDNSHLYVIGRTDIHTFEDLGSTIEKRNKKYVGEDLETIYTENNNVFIGSKSSMIVMTKTSNPQKVSSYTHVVSCDPVLPHGNIAYLTLRSVGSNGCNNNVNAVEVIDISNINNPTKINEVQLNSPYGMAVMNNRLFIGEGNNGLSVLDISSPANPILLNTYRNISTFDVIKHPTDSDALLITGSNGIKQLSYNTNTNSITELSEIIAP